VKIPVKVDNTLLIFRQVLVVIQQVASITQTISAIVYSVLTEKIQS
jgi:hypothetical protein